MRLRKGEKERFARIKELLTGLGLYTDARALALLALTDDVTPNEFGTLRRAGRPLSAAARTSHVFDYVAARLRLAKRLDREQRDYVFVQLREVGLIDICWVLPADEAERQGKLITYGVHDPKSPNNAYVLTSAARKLLLETPKTGWKQALRKWGAGDKRRRIRIAQRTAAQTVSSAGSSGARHSALIRSCVDALQDSIASGFELAFVDEADGERIAAKWEKPLDKLGLKPDLESPWPDAILVKRRAKQVWFVDAVKTDGEIDEIRAQALRDWATGRGFKVAGMTTAYESWRDVARRQGKHKNLAIGTTLWVAEDGGKLLSVGSVVK
jgi:hypothetical protein